MYSESVHLREFGPPSAPPVLALHGQMVDGTHLDALVARLSRSRRVLVPDLPAWGRSPPLVPHEARTVRACLEELLARRGLASVDAVGSSLGAYHVLALALAGNVRIERMALLGPLAGLDPPDRAAYAGFASAVERGDRIGGVALELMFSAGWRARHADRAADLVRRLDALPPAHVAADLRLASELPDLRADLGRLRGRVLIRTGARDASTPLSRVEGLHRALRSSVLQVVPEAGHLLLVEDERETVEAIDRFLTESGEESPGGR